MSVSAAAWSVIAALIIFAPLIQGGSPRLPTAVVEVAILALVLHWAYRWGWRDRRQELRLSLLDALLALFFFWALFSLGLAPYYHSAEKAFILLLCYGLLYWWMVCHPSLFGPRRALGAVCLQGILQAAVVWYQWLVLGDVRPTGTFYNPNFLASFCAAAAVLTLAAAVFPRRDAEGQRRWRVVVACLAAALMAGAVVLSGSRGGVLALGCGLFVLCVFRSGRWTAAGTAAVAGLLLLVPNPLTQRLMSLSQADVFAYSRFSIWRSGLQMLWENPWAGVGLGQYEYFSPRYAFAVEGHWAPYSRVAENPHSEYLLAGAEMGFFGLLICLVPLALFGYWTWRRIRQADDRERCRLVPPAAALAALLVHAAVDFNLHTPPTALLLVLMSATLRLRGVEGPSWAVGVQIRPFYATCGAALVLATILLVLRPLFGFWYFLDGIGSPQNLLREKWALQKAQRRPPPLPEALSSFEKAARIDFVCAPYHNVLGATYFKTFFSAAGEVDHLQKGLYHARFAAQLNPNHFRYQINLAEAAQSIHRHLRGGRTLLLEAVGHYRRAAKLAPYNYRIYEEWGLLFDTLGEPGKAERLLRKAVELEPHYRQGWYNLATFYARHNMREKAAAAFRRGAESAAEGWDRRVSTPYEEGLVDLDPQLFENGLRKLGRADEATGNE